MFVSMYLFHMFVFFFSPRWLRMELQMELQSFPIRRIFYLLPRLHDLGGLGLRGLQGHVRPHLRVPRPGSGAWGLRAAWPRAVRMEECELRALDELRRGKEASSIWFLTPRTLNPPPASEFGMPSEGPNYSEEVGRSPSAGSSGRLVGPFVAPFVARDPRVASAGRAGQRGFGALPRDWDAQPLPHGKRGPLKETLIQLWWGLPWRRELEKNDT